MQDKDATMRETASGNTIPTASLDARVDALMESSEVMFEDLVLDITGEMCALMDEQKVSRSELARRIGVKPPHVTRLLQGQDNFTLRTLTRIARALGSVVRCTLAPAGSVTRFVHSFEGGRDHIDVAAGDANVKRGSFKANQFARVVMLEEGEATLTASEKTA
jgi:transcriptional regulator with XRE-family HTH domain